MTGSEYCKSQGLDSVVELSILSDVPKSTLDRMWNKKNKTYKVLVAGAVSIKINIKLGGVLWALKD